MNANVIHIILNQYLMAAIGSPNFRLYILKLFHGQVHCTCGAYGNTSFEIGAGRYFYVNANVIHTIINQYLLAAIGSPNFRLHILKLFHSQVHVELTVTHASK